MNNQKNKTEKVLEKKDEQIMDTNNILKSIKKDIPIGADLVYVSASQIIARDNDDYIGLGLTITLILISLSIGIFQYLLISRQNKWYYNAIYACDCEHCSRKKNISSCSLKIRKYKFLGLLSASLHIISFLTFAYFHGEPFNYYGVYNQNLSFLILILWAFINALIHKVVSINVPKYVQMSMAAIRKDKTSKKELLASQYKRKIEKRYNGMVQKHLKYIQNNVNNHDDCFCEYDLDNVSFAELELGIMETNVGEENNLMEIKDKLDKLKQTENQLRKQLTDLEINQNNNHQILEIKDEDDEMEEETPENK